MITESLIARSSLLSFAQHELQFLNRAAPARVVSAAPGLFLKLRQPIRLVRHESKALRQIGRRDLRRNQVSCAELDNVGNASDIRSDDRNAHSQELQESDACHFGAGQHASDINIANNLDETVHVD